MCYEKVKLEREEVRVAAAECKSWGLEIRMDVSKNRSNIAKIVWRVWYCSTPVRRKLRNKDNGMYIKCPHKIRTKECTLQKMLNWAGLPCFAVRVMYDSQVGGV